VERCALPAALREELEQMKKHYHDLTSIYNEEGALEHRYVVCMGVVTSWKRTPGIQEEEYMGKKIVRTRFVTEETELCSKMVWNTL
jgi:hypothetical protein